MQVAIAPPAAPIGRFAPPFAEDDDSLAAAAALRITESLVAAVQKNAALSSNLIATAIQQSELASTLLRDDDQMGNDAMASLIDSAVLPSLRRATSKVDPAELVTAHAAARAIAYSLELPYTRVHDDIQGPAR